MEDKIRFVARGDSSIQLVFGNEISEEINEEIRKFIYALECEKISGVSEWIPSYCHLNVIYDAENYYYEEIADQLYKIKEKLSEIEAPQAKNVKIPVFYGGQYGPDLENVASHTGLAKEEIIRIHSEKKYLIYMLGFTPGFPYLGGMDERIATPRLKEPREKIWAGSVGIAGTQTGIYPIESPGGWQIIGRTPLKLFDPQRKQEILLRTGDYITFYPADPEEYFAEKGGRDGEEG